MGGKNYKVVYILSIRVPVSRYMWLSCVFSVSLSKYLFNQWFLAGLHKVHPAYRMVNAGRVGTRASLIGYLLCVINSSYIFKLTFFKPCTVVMDTLKMCMWLFSSPELKAQVSYSDRPLSVVRLSVNFYIFDFSSRTTGPILTKLGTNHPWGGGDYKLLKPRGLLFSEGK